MPSEAKRMSAHERREQVLDVTLAIVDAEGFHAATPQRIADEAGVTRAVLYQQFGDIAALFVALIDREGSRAAQQLAQETAARTGDSFVRILEGAIAAIDARPATWRLFLVPPEGAPPALYDRLATSQSIVRSLVRTELIAAYPQVADPDYLARIIHAAGRELLLLRLTEPEQATPQRLRALVEQLVSLGRSAS